MDQQFKNIKVLIWDFDGTFYKPNPELFKKVREAEYQVIAKHTGWSLGTSISEFEKLYKKVIDSATQVVAKLSNITVSQAAIEMEKYFDRTEFVAHDEKLIELFTKLKNYRHFTLANGVIANHIKTLQVLGLDPAIFEEMVTSETVGITKPDLAGFNYILQKTQLPPSQHMMIGDRVVVDLEPAKKVGMKTCLVWSEKKSELADVTLSTVYEVSNLLI